MVENSKNQALISAEAGNSPPVSIQAGNLAPDEQLQVDYQRLVEECDSLKEELEAAKNALKEIEDDRMTSIVIGDLIGDGICITDGKGVVVAINQGYTNITEITEDQIIGKSIPMLLEEGYFTNAVTMEILEKRKQISAISTIKKSGRQVLLMGAPFFDKEGNIVKVITVMRNMTELVKLQTELQAAEKQGQKYKEELSMLRKERMENSFIGKDPAILRVKELIDYVAGTEATVLITGETGSGKEVVAREIYKKSKRKDGPYVKINCSAIPENLLESELFGYVKGAFTGADSKDKKGLFEVANHGTILLDEIGDMPMKLQIKLLRVLQEREITRVGGTEAIKIDTRIIVSTNGSLEALIKQNLFRADLYYRLNVFPIKLPALRERKMDIPEISGTFLVKFNRLYGKKKTLGVTAIAALTEYHWPGNVRELENIIERMVIISHNEILAQEDVTAILSMGEGPQKQDKALQITGLSLKEAVAAYEKEILEAVLKEHGTSYAAAEVLKTTQPTIVRKAQALGIPLGRPGGRS